MNAADGLYLNAPKGPRKMADLFTVRLADGAAFRELAANMGITPAELLRNLALGALKAGPKSLQGARV